MCKKGIMAVLGISALLSGCSWQKVIYQPQVREPQTITTRDADFPWYNKTEIKEYDHNNEPYTITEESLFGCPSEPNEQFGCIEFRRDGETGCLDGNYEEKEMYYKTDKCFATFTDLDTGEVFYQLYRKSTTQILFDAGDTYIVVPQEVFDRLTKITTEIPLRPYS